MSPSWKIVGAVVVVFAFIAPVLVRGDVTSTTEAAKEVVSTNLTSLDEFGLVMKWCDERNYTVSTVGNCTDPKNDCWNQIVLDAFNQDSNNKVKVRGNWPRRMNPPKVLCEKATVATATTTEASVTSSSTDQSASSGNVTSNVDVTTGSTLAATPGPVSQQDGTNHWTWLGPLIALVVIILTVATVFLAYRRFKRPGYHPQGSVKGSANGHGETKGNGETKEQV